MVFIREYKKKKKAHLLQISTIDETHKEELLETQLEIQTQTMQYIGQEIHDNIGQKLTLASIYTQQLIFENKAPAVNETIEGINDIINQSLQELRQLSKSLTDDSIKNNTLSYLIEKECEKINDLKKWNVHFSSTIEMELQSYQIKSILFRITQEFLQNSMKHAACENIFVALKTTSNAIKFTLQDDGIGFNSKTIKPDGIGLKNIKKRTELVGGKMKLESQENKGTKLIIEIPI
ncbi:ATP-binding protein [Tenacibaculum sp. HL-MS23]|uniref:sensor histidine kinase n=1 Tax=Tenacibaculum sp. HL-MS23 TaxID=3077734 RepID=UPI0028FC1862|nr:ATP-binding protein [Tenacibaculum sp. HL-MS23]WNW02474.1 ATP-binding protein [Tenacibaculum sp. HL-MS23]